MNWTLEQEQAINEDGKNIIVSAGAGSGKTAVLSERVIRKLKQKININELLILTFTNAAAAEMKDRIRKKIKKDSSLKDQLDYLEQAYITTFDSYALSVVKKYNYLLNIPKNIKPTDSIIINIKKKQILNDILENLYKAKNEKFLNLIDSFCIKNDDEITNAILKIASSLDKKYDKEEYLNTYIENYYNEKTINENIKKYTDNLIELEQEIEDTFYELEQYLDTDYYEKCADILNKIFNPKNYNDLLRVNDLSRLPNLPKDTPEEAKKLKKQLSEKIKQLKNKLKYKDQEELKQGIIKTKDHVEILIDIIKELDKQITKYKEENSAYEFDDIAKMAIKVVKENPNIKEELKYTYNEIMVDEYQDTSDLQETFLKLIENNNIYMVGDIKQSIYRFRNANPDIFKQKYEDYKNNINGYKIDLVKNFRSRKEVLNNINEIFNLIMDKEIGGADYEQTHQMVFGNNTYEENKENQNYDLEIYNYEEDKNYTKEEIEAFIIAQDIKDKIKNKYQVLKEGKLQDASYEDFCIIMDRGTAFPTYKKIFEYMQIPLLVMQDEEMTSKEDILVLKNIITLITKIKENKLDKEAKYCYTSIARSFLEEQPDNDIFETLKEDKLKETKIYNICKEIAKDIENKSIENVINQILKEFNFYEKIIKIGNINDSIIRIEKTKEMANNLSNLGYTLNDFIEYLNQVIESKEEIKYQLPVEDTKSVKLMNIHKSKGLEFSICYFSGLHKPFNKQDIKERFIYDNEYGIITPYFDEGITETILKDLVINKYNQEDISERIRLLYVDVTRAKEKMIIVTSLKDEQEPYQKTLLDQSIRKKYKSFQDIINSIKQNLIKYIKNIDLEQIPLSKDYQIKNENKELKENTNIKIKEIKLNIENNQIEEQKASKNIKKILTKEEISNMEYGTKMHELFEITDFHKETQNQNIKKLIDKLDIKDAKIYKEHEFIFSDETNEYHGIIDLILEYKDKIKIIDYKLQNTKDDAYLNQLQTYKKYINQISDKKVQLYLYSILKDELVELKEEK